MARELSDIIEMLKQEYLFRFDMGFDNSVNSMKEKCQSPIELVLAVALSNEMLWMSDIEFFYNCNAPLQADELFKIHYRKIGPDFCAAIYIQMPLGQYRIDFYLEAFSRRNHERFFALAIECDGHDFHEKTKEQAIRDKRKDRWLQQHNIRIMRFAGAEIWADPSKCANEVLDAFCSACRNYGEIISLHNKGNNS